jgi:Clr5 domain
MTRKPSPREWEAQKDRFIDIYITQDCSLVHAMAEMATVYHFSATYVWTTLALSAIALEF